MVGEISKVMMVGEIKVEIKAGEISKEIMVGEIKVEMMAGEIRKEIMMDGVMDGEKVVIKMIGVKIIKAVILAFKMRYSEINQIGEIIFQVWNG